MGVQLRPAPVSSPFPAVSSGPCRSPRRSAARRVALLSSRSAFCRQRCKQMQKQLFRVPPSSPMTAPPGTTHGFFRMSAKMRVEASRKRERRGEARRQTNDGGKRAARLGWCPFVFFRAPRRFESRRVGGGGACGEMPFLVANFAASVTNALASTSRAAVDLQTLNGTSDGQMHANRVPDLLNDVRRRVCPQMFRCLRFKRHVSRR